jgi:hypothetical protein
VARVHKLAPKHAHSRILTRLRKAHEQLTEARQIAHAEAPEYVAGVFYLQEVLDRAMVALVTTDVESEKEEI